MNMHSADATTAEEAIAIQETLDSDMATEVAMQDTLLTPRFYTTDFEELDNVFKIFINYLYLDGNLMAQCKTIHNSYLS